MVLSGPLEPQRATVLTKDSNQHLILLWDCWDWHFDGIIIPNGFKSGYGGEGARGFSLALCMLHERHVPIDCLEVIPRVFNRIDKGKFPDQLQERVKDFTSECEMPVPGWIFVNHWELTKSHRLWRVQQWRSRVIEWTNSADIVDDFSWTIGDKLYQACQRVNRNAPSEIFQQVGLILRDAWIEFSLTVRTRIGEIAEQPGKNDVKAIVEALNLNEDLTRVAKKAYDSTNVLHHDRKAKLEKAEVCFNASVAAMAEIISARFPGQFDPRKDELIPPN